MLNPESGEEKADSSHEKLLAEEEKDEDMPKFIKKAPPRKKR